MKERGKRLMILGCISISIFVLWTILIQTVDVQPIGVNGTTVGFAAFNTMFHKWTGVHMNIYYITDWLGLVPVFVCMVFGCVGFVQLVKRKSLRKVDRDIILLGIYYVLVIMGYLVFEMIPINYRPILIDGFMEASYPSSTTLLILSVMPTLTFQSKRRIENRYIQKSIEVFSNLFIVFMVGGRLISGVHWFTDIVGSVMLSVGMFHVYKGLVVSKDKEI